MTRHSVGLLAALACLVAQPSLAADLRETREAAPSWAPEPEPEKHVLVEVEGLYLRSGCPGDRDCLPPRVLPAPSTRSVDLVTLGIPVDPRFTERYR